MCLLFEMTWFVVGIIVLARGKLRLSHQKTVTGTPAFVIGVIMVGSLPFMFLCGMFMPLADAALLGGVPNPFALYWLLEVFLNLVVLGLVLGIAFATATPEVASAKLAEEPSQEANDP